MSLTLFNSEEAASGYRLDYMEVFNWGTFHGNVYGIRPGLKTSLLTGANASGKTTLVDALLTLLVPSGKRFYNQSSGAESKKERDELSYFWGQYGRTYSEAEEGKRDEKLRKKEDNPYSVLLANFKNTGLQQQLTLVQVRWFSAGGLKRVYIVSPHELTINDHFGKGRFDTRGEWKKKLQQQFAKTDLFDTFKEYAGRFSELFGLKDQALPLFNQVVGIKVLGNLTQFIRNQMLDQPDVETQFAQLYEHYNDLLLSHKAIQKDEKQLELLEPVIQSKEALSAVTQEIQSFEETERFVPQFLDEMEAGLLEMNARKLEEEIEVLEEQQKQLAETITGHEALERQLITQKASLNLDSRIELARKDIDAEASKRDSKRQKWTEYTANAKVLQLQTEVDAERFRENQEYTRLLEKEWGHTIEQLTDQKASCRIEADKLRSDCEEWQETITSLLSRRDRMPVQLINVRRKLAALLDVSEETLPFAGELMRVKEDELLWEDSIERVLNGLAMQLLVPQRYHKAVNAYVHANNLQTRLVYQRIEDRVPTTMKRWPTNQDSLLNKLDFKESGIYRDWLEYQLIQHYDYYCTDDLDDFYGSVQALTSNGLLRKGGRHEKDDRPNQWSRVNYRLGWDNTAIVRLLMEQKKQAESDIAGLTKQLSNIHLSLQDFEIKKRQATLLLAVGAFHDIDFGYHAAAVARLEKQLEDLINSSDKYKVISDQLIQCSAELVNLRKEDKALEVSIGGLKKEYRDQSRRRGELTFDDLSETGRQLVISFIRTELQTEILPRSLEDLQQTGKRLHEVLRKKGQQLRSALGNRREAMITMMTAFCNPPGSVLTEFPDWNGDLINIRPDIDQINEFEDLYKQIKHQKLVEHKRKFRDYMDNSMLDALTNFRTWLDNEEEKIKEMIEDLNQPLKRITFSKNPDTYLQLESRTDRDEQMKGFKKRLSETIPDILTFSAQKEQAYRDSVFLKIKELIEDLKKDEPWRRKVTDVRNRLAFSAREYTVAEHKPGQYHEDTSSYSGGQKAQFTYTILGAAIAYQFGIFQQGKQSRSLRFITVDEAFSKLDPEKSSFLMEFCNQLHLQLLVVTPLDKINVAEPYINAVHFVEIKNKMHSNVYNLTMEQYYERKEEFQQLEMNEDDQS